MNETFKKYVDALDPIFKRLISMKPVKINDLPSDIPKSGIYLFSENETNLYVGRSTRIKARLQEHCRPSSTNNSAPFAFKIARETSGKINASYTTNGSRAQLELDNNFKIKFDEAKILVSNMDIRFIEERDPLRQCLLEIYTAISLSAKYNDFDTH